MRVDTDVEPIWDQKSPLERFLDPAFMDVLERIHVPYRMFYYSTGEKPARLTLIGGVARAHPDVERWYLCTCAECSRAGLEYLRSDLLKLVKKKFEGRSIQPTRVTAMVSEFIAANLKQRELLDELPLGHVQTGVTAADARQACPFERVPRHVPDDAELWATGLEMRGEAEVKGSCVWVTIGYRNAEWRWLQDSALCREPAQGF